MNMIKRMMALAAMLICGFPVQAAITVEATNWAPSGSGGQTTLNITASPGDTIIVYGRGSNGASFGTVSDDGGNTYSYGPSVLVGPGAVGMAWSVAIENAVTSVTFNCGGTGYAVIGVWVLSSDGDLSVVDSDALLYNFSAPDTTDGVTTKSMTLSSASGMLIGASYSGSGSAMSLGTSFTQSWSSPDGFEIGEHRAVTASGAITFTTAEDGAYVSVAGVLVQEDDGGDPDPEPVVATKLTFGSQPGNIIVGQTFGAFTVRAVNDSNELDEDFDGDVTLALATGKGELEGTLTEAAVAGIATFDDVHIDTLNVGAVIMATADGLTAAYSDEFDVTAGTGDGTAGFPASSRLGGLLQ